MYDLTGKNVVYIGGFSGIGYQVCRMMMKKKINNLIVCSRMENVEMLKKLQSECPSVKVMFVQMNIMDRVNIEIAVKQIVGTIKHIDVLVNGAGVLADKDVETTIGVNLLGVINTTMVCLPYMDKSQMGVGGIVLNIASVYGLEPGPLFPIYAAAKHGVIGFTRSMGDEHIYHKTGVAFICVCPGLTQTEMMMNLRENMPIEDVMPMVMVDMMMKVKRQTPEECAVNIMKVIEMMKNGGIFICNLGQLKEVMATNYWQM